MNDEFEFSYARHSDMFELTRIFCEGFGDDADFSRGLANACLSVSGTLPVIRKDGRVVAALYYEICDLYSRGKKLGDCAYLFGASTKWEYRGRGLMKRLVNRSAEALALDRKIKAVFLFPANIGLFQYYKILGFTEFFGAAKLKYKAQTTGPCGYPGCRVLPLSVFDKAAVTETYRDYAEHAKSQILSPVKSKTLYSRFAEGYICGGKNGASFGLFANSVEKFCHLFYKKDINGVRIDDIIPCAGNFDGIGKIADGLAGFFAAEGLDCEITLPARFADNYEYTAMVRFLDGGMAEKFDPRAIGTGELPYINLYLND